MGKKKHKPTADHTRNKRKGHEKKVNPFEVKVNRQKHDVLGRKMSKFDKGMPGVSRSKATKKRKATLLKEYEQQFKKNRFVDKRIGEHDTGLSLEEKMMKRYAMERSKSSVKNKFNLNEEEELTHYGQSLADIEKFDEPIISDEEEDDDDRRAAAKLVAQEHFGGFLQRRNPDDEKKSWKERMEDMIKESKKKKHERQMEKEETVQMTEELDEQWKSLHSLISKSKMKGKNEEDAKKTADDYDIAVRSLQFEMKGQATDRLKSEEELAKDEKERLEKLEADRIRRMKGLTEEESRPKPKHRSADDLDDGFALEPQDFDYVSYKDGELNKEKTDDDSDGDDDNVSEPGNSDHEGDDEDCYIDDDNDDMNEKPKEDDAGDDEDEQNVAEDDDNSSSDAEDNYEDLESDREEDVENIPEDVKQQKKVEDKLRLTMIEQAKKELPYTFKAPASYDELLDILEGHNMEDQLTIIERIRKCHHPSLAEGNKQKLEKLFGHLVQFYGDLCIQDPPQVDFADRLVTPLYELTQMSREIAGTVITANLMNRQEEFAEICQKKAGRGLYPGLDTLLLFKLVSILFPTSDFRHSVTTPSLLFMCQVLGQSSVHSGRDVVAGLFLCNLCLEYVSMSKRYIPEVINFLHGLLFYAADKETNKIESVIPPFKPVGKSISLLHISNEVKSIKHEKWSLSEMLAPVVEENLYGTDQFRITSICRCFRLLSEYRKLYCDLSSFKEIFTPVLYMCHKLPKHKYPTELQNMINDFTASCEEPCNRKKAPLVMQKKKPKPLKMFEPKVEEKFDGRKKGRRGTRDFNEKQKMIHKYKKEMKGAVRELKKDTRFLARQKLHETMEKDFERKRKVKEIMGGLAHQEGDYKKMKRGVKPE
ncbi:nucleolar protein 14-like [Mercenaria mercenaria]|uniref:nucleolar protein 14-like n=1 Tax=Mercenaria mercenaria TaxID=6596 RepID=UPI00234EE9BE|nr:nucleolar protein 14-like [Mercenaria mercenaria]